VLDKADFISFQIACLIFAFSFIFFLSYPSDKHHSSGVYSIVSLLKSCSHKAILVTHEIQNKNTTNINTRVGTDTIIQYTLCPKKRPPFYFSNNSVKNYPILMIFGVLNPEKS